MAVYDLVHTRPELVATLGSLRRNHLRCGPFSGYHLWELGLRETADVDLFTHPDDFPAVIGMMPPGLLSCKHVTMYDALGKAMRFASVEFDTVLDGVPVQIVRPLSGVAIEGWAAERDLSFTDLTAEHLEPCVVGGTIINRVPRDETRIARALFQRPPPKHDWDDLVGLGVYAPVSYDYLRARAEESGFGPREYAYLGAAGIDLYQKTRVISLVA